MEFVRKTLPQQHYIFVERKASMTGTEIADAMASGFGEVFSFKEKLGIEPLSMPTAIYTEMPAGDQMAFRTGFFVSAEDAARAEGPVQSGVIMAGEAFTTTHAGPYANLHETHKALWDHMEAQGVEGATPFWEVYIDDPTTTPEAELRTEILRMAAS